MTTSHGPITCGACGGLVATISEAGLALPWLKSQNQSCSVCDQVRPLHDAMKSADELYASLAGRRDTYGPKQNAFADVKRTHREFSNLLAIVEDSTKQSGEELPERQPDMGNEAEVDENEDETHNTKRARSHSSNNVLGVALSESTGLTNTSALPKLKRLKFSESVEFREDYRPSDSYARSNEAYVRGRYAPPDDGEHLDTSGSDKSFLKFTGMKKVGKKWVDVWKDDSVGDTASAQANDSRITDVEDEGPVPEDQRGAIQPISASPNTRTARLARRRSTSPKYGVISGLDARSSMMLQPAKAANAGTEGMAKADPGGTQLDVPDHGLEQSLSQQKLDITPVREIVATHNAASLDPLATRNMKQTKESLSQVTQNTASFGHMVEEKFPIRTGSVTLNTGKLHLHGEESDSKNLMLAVSRPGMGDDTPYFDL
ncbi:hypothetical protein DE146DRAFT_425854 [Phaeosphaeria sp. MPI-PUGE-AT-0046c]|nr:hypothetical protein DE146DRAFT_425854 [Phaeosphaeria sp. MPI-PUGE-AT-0046c]